MPTNSINPWTKNSGDFHLDNTSAHIWRVHLPVHESALLKLESYLSHEELKRMQNLSFMKDKQNFVASRGILRFLLGRYLSCKPDELTFSYKKHGKPHIPANDISFNVSHSGEYILYVFTKKAAVGIDIEKIRDDSTVQKVIRTFSQQEQKTLVSLSHHEQKLAFFRLWTRKEAYLKAIATGLSYPLALVEVTCLPTEKAALLKIEDQHLITQWQLEDIPLNTPGLNTLYCAAVALEHRRNLIFWDVVLPF